MKVKLTSNQSNRLSGRISRPRRLALAPLSLALLALAAPAVAQAAAAGTSIASKMTLPSGIIKVNNEIWVADHASGFCRLSLPPAGTTGTGAIDPATCVTDAVSPGQAAYAPKPGNPAAGYIFVPDNSSKGVGVWRYDYTFDPVSGRGQLSNPILMANNLINGHRPAAVAYYAEPTGTATTPPKDYLYVTTLKDNVIFRIDNPTATRDVVASTQKILNVGATVDRRGPPAIAVLKGDLYLAEAIGMSRVPSIALCAGVKPLCTAVPLPTPVAAPIYVTNDDAALYIADLKNAYRFVDACATNIAPGFNGISSLGIQLGESKLYVGNDSTLGATPSTGEVYEVPFSPTTTNCATSGTTTPPPTTTPASAPAPSPNYSITQIASGMNTPGALLQIGADTWITDKVLGFCRVTASGIETSSCAPRNSTGAPVSPGQAVFYRTSLASDPITGYVYVPDNSSKSLGVYRYTYQKGALTNPTLLPNSGSGNRPTAVAVDSKGDLYVSLLKSNTILRVSNPGGSSPSSETVGFAAGRVGPPALGAVLNTGGTDLYLAEASGITKIAGVEGCNRNNPGFCTARGYGTGVNAPVYVAADNTGLFIGDSTTAYRFEFMTGALTQLANGFVNLSGIGYAGTSVYVGDDTSAGINPTTGRLWQIEPKPLPTTVP